MAKSDSSQGEPFCAGQSLQSRLHGTNINAETFLASDFLNHFNEIIMLIDMIPDVPGCYAEAREWRPKSYIEHFEDSSFSEKELAIEAYLKAPARYREPLEEIANRLNESIAALLSEIESPVAKGQRAECAELVNHFAHSSRLMIQLASAIINGAIGGTMGTEPVGMVEDQLNDQAGDHSDQDEIDKLF